MCHIAHMTHYTDGPSGARGFARGTKRNPGTSLWGCATPARALHTCDYPLHSQARFCPETRCPAAMSSPKYDLVIYGATGFTGRLAATYVAERYSSTLKWALAGRNAAKLEALRGELGVDMPIIVADASDVDAVASMVSNARVIANFAGTPFIDKALPIVKCCVESGTHYVDITGPWPQRCPCFTTQAPAVARGTALAGGVDIHGWNQTETKQDWSRTNGDASEDPPPRLYSIPSLQTVTLYCYSLLLLYTGAL